MSDREYIDTVNKTLQDQMLAMQQAISELRATLISERSQADGLAYHGIGAHAPKVELDENGEEVREDSGESVRVPEVYPILFEDAEGKSPTFGGTLAETHGTGPSRDGGFVGYPRAVMLNPQSYSNSKRASLSGPQEEEH